MFRLTKCFKAVAIAQAVAALSFNVSAQQVALLDAGIDPGAGLNTVAGFNYFTNSEDTSEKSSLGHGTTSARLIAESFSGQIIPFVITDGTRNNPGQTRVARDNALSDILGRSTARVVAMSWGTPGITSSAAPLVSQLSNDNRVIAIMAGNEFSTQPNALSTSSFNLSGVIIVGGADANGNLLDKTNRAGTTANKYVTAIGTTSLNSDEGSSFATAHVAGIAGAVLQQNPNMTNTQVVDVILSSAEDRGAAGVDSEYGHGFIRDAAQVLNNVMGETSSPSSGGGSSGGGGGAALIVGGAVAGAFLLYRKRSDKLEKTLVLDSYGRGFHIDLNDHVSINDGELHLDDFFNALEQTGLSQGIELPSLKTQIAYSAITQKDKRFDAAEYFALDYDPVINEQALDLSLSLLSQFDNGVKLGAGYRVDPSMNYGAISAVDNGANEFASASFVTGQSFSSLLSGFSSQATTLDVGYQAKSTSKTSLKLGLVSVDDEREFGLNSLSTILQGNYEFNDNAGVSLQFGQLEENGSLFGGSSNGSFSVDNATTYALNLAGNLKLSDKFHFVANYGVGHTKVKASRNSYLQNFTNLRSDWYSLGVIGSNVIRAKDQIGLAFSQPLKVNSGSVDYDLPVAGYAGNVQFDSERVNLGESNATEHKVEAYYRTMLNEKMELGAYATYRQNPYHISDNGDDAMVLFTFRYRQ